MIAYFLAHVYQWPYFTSLFPPLYAGTNPPQLWVVLRNTKPTAMCFPPQTTFFKMQTSYVPFDLFFNRHCDFLNDWGEYVVSIGRDRYGRSIIVRKRLHISLRLNSAVFTSSAKQKIRFLWCKLPKYISFLMNKNRIIIAISSCKYTSKTSMNTVEGLVSILSAKGKLLNFSLFFRNHYCHFVLWIHVLLFELI